MNEPVEAHSRDAASTERLLAVVRAVAAELRPAWADRPVGLDAALDRDLGFDSLGRAELVARLEQTFGVALPDSLLAAAETPRDLLNAVIAAAGRGAPPGAMVAGSETASAAGPVDVPMAAATLAEVLDWHATRHPERVHVRLYADDGDGEALTYGDLAAAARRIAAGLHARELGRGEAVALMLPTERDYFACFLGVILAGGVAVPTYPPTRMARIEEHLRRQLCILVNARARILLTAPEALTAARLLKAQAPDLAVVATPAELAAAGAGVVPAAVPLRGDDIAFLQYTSGSTGNPKGVILSHANVLANIRAMAAAIRATPEDVFVSWLPLYHDMGLIGAWLGCLHHGTPLVIMPPLAFLARPARWLTALHRFRGSISGGPNFAYELVLRRLTDADIAGLDLSCWRIAFNGAEPVSADTLERFASRFAACGLRRQALAPVYGLAENAVGVAFPPPERGPLIDTVRREPLMAGGRAEPAGPGESSVLRLVACGQPLTGHQIRIVDVTGREVPDRREGRVQLRGPSATRGYFRRPEANARLFDGDWLNTGDRGYIAAGDLYLIGRDSDIIIRGGRNIYPTELEEAVARIDGVIPGGVAAFGHVDPAAGTERLIIVAESRRRDGAAAAAMTAAIDAIVTDQLGEPADDVVLAPPGSIPRTSSGKIRRSATRQLYLDGAIGRPQAAPWLQVLRLAAVAAAMQVRRFAGVIAGALYSAWVWGLIGLLAPPLWLATMAMPGLQRRWRLLRTGARLLARLAGIPIIVHGAEHLGDEAPPAIIACNHASYADVFVLMAVLAQPVAFVAKAELARSPLIRWPLARLGTLFVERFDPERGLADYRAVAAAARAGRSPLFFPEGTFRRMPGLLPFHMGAFTAAVDAGLPIVPMVLRGTRSILRAGSWLPHRGAVQVTILPAIAAPPADRGWQRAVRLRDAVRAAILRHTGEPDLDTEKIEWQPPTAPSAAAPRRSP